MSEADDLNSVVFNLFRGSLYTAARQAIIRFETTEEQRSTANIIEFRDALEHIARAAHASDPEEIRQLMVLAEEHLRRAAAEPAQDMVESRLDAIRRSVRFYWLKRFIFSGLPDYSSLQAEVHEIKRLLELGRSRKAEPENFELALENLGEAHRLSRNLDISLHLSGLRSYWKVILWAIPVALGVVAIVIAL